MNEKLEGGQSPETGKGFWEGVLEHDDDTILPLTITNPDGSDARHGTIRVGDVRRQMSDPGYQAMTRRAKKQAEEMTRGTE